MITDLYTIKSFFSLGDSLPHCLGCDYCRAEDNEEYHYDVLPGEINPWFKELPVAVNLFYGDPTLQWDNTIRLLRRLEENEHSGPVVIIVKGDLTKHELPTDLKLNLHIGVSIGPDSLSKYTFESNLDYLSKLGRYSYHIEFRPICRGINDSTDFVEYVIKTAAKHNISVAYSGLQLPPGGLPDKYIPYDGHKFGGLKHISDDEDKLIRAIGERYGVLVFRKTSCLISYEECCLADINTHYYKPVESGCEYCFMRKRCNEQKNTIPDGLEDVLPFDFDVVWKEKYACSFVEKGLCKKVGKECVSMSGYFIVPKNVDTITRGDARVIKWLTGIMVDDVKNLIETPHLSDFWKK